MGADVVQYKLLDPLVSKLLHFITLLSFLKLPLRLGNYVTTKKLVECGSDVGQVDLENKTVLHLLPDNTQNATHVTFLLQNGNLIENLSKILSNNQGRSQLLT